MFARIAVGLSLALLVAVLLAAQVSAAPGDGPAPAAPVRPAGVDAAQNQFALRVNEYMASNATGLEDPAEPGEFPDWIEIYNPTNQAVSLTGLALTDNLDNPDKAPIPPGLTIPANGYIVFFADNDPEQGPLHLDFALSGDGEEIALYVISTETAIDARVFGAQQTDVSEGRHPDGGDAWKKYNVPTPGQSNELNPPEIGAFGHTPAIPGPGESATVTATVTDDGSLAQVSVLYTIGAGNPITLPMTGGGGNVYQATIPAQPLNTLVRYQVYARDNENNDGLSWRKGYVVGYQAPQVRISEIMAENNSALQDPDEPGEYPDWIELHNPGATPLNLGGLSLSDNPFEPEKFTLQSSLTIPPNGYIVFFLDDDPEQGAQHGGFSLNKNGESVAIYGGSGTMLIDSHTFGQQLDNISIGLHPQTGEWVQLLCPTPGAPNVICDQFIRLPVVQGKP